MTLKRAMTVLLPFLAILLQSIAKTTQVASALVSDRH